MARLRALLVDVGDTLVDFGPFSVAAYGELLAERLFEAFAEMRPWFARMPSWEQLAGESPPFEQDNRRMVAALLQEHGETLADEEFRLIQRACAVPLTELAARGLVRLDAIAVDAVREARALGLKMATCTNTPWTGAPHPSTPICGSVPVARPTALAIASWSGCEGRR